MFQNKLFNIGLIIMISISLLGVAAVVGFKYVTTTSATPKTPTADELAKGQFVVDKITTNLSGMSLIQVGFTVQADSDKTKAELDLRKSQVKDAINTILHKTTKVDLEKPEGLNLLKENVRKKIQSMLSHGQILDVYISDIVIQ